MSGTPRTIFLIIILWAAGLLAGAQFAKMSVLLPELRALYPASAEHVSWLLTLVSIVGAVFGGLAGRFANRVGPKRLLIASLVMAGVLSLWQSTYPPFVVMAVSRILEGVTHLGIVVTAPALMAQTSAARWRGATMALWSTFFGVSFAIFAWFGVPQLEHLQVSGLFQIHGGFMLLAALLVLTLLGHHRRDPVSPQTDQDDGADRQATRIDLNVLWPGVGWLFYTLTFLALLTILPLQMQNDIRPQMTTVMSLLGIGTSLLLVPLLLLRLSSTRVVLAGFALAALVTGFGSGLNVLVLAIMLFAVLGLVQGGAFAAAADLNQSTAKRTLSYGFMAQTGNLGNLIGTPLLLFVLDRNGAQMLLLTVAVIYLAGLVSLTMLALRMRTGGEAQ